MPVRVGRHDRLAVLRGLEQQLAVETVVYRGLAMFSRDGQTARLRTAIDAAVCRAKRLGRGGSGGRQHVGWIGLVVDARMM